MIKLYGLDISGNTYKVKLLLHFLGLKYQSINLNIDKKEHKSAAFLKLNPRGEFPVLEDGSIVIWDSQAILIYLARQYGNQPNHKHWYPDNAVDMARITQWLTVANDDIFHSLGKARSMLKFAYAGDLELYQSQGKATLQRIEQHLSHRLWLATEQPSIADIACYPYIALCEEGHVSLAAYKSINHWLMRIQKLQAYITMPGLSADEDR